MSKGLAPELQESAMHSPLEPPPPDTPSSDDEVNALLLAEAQTYREMVQVALERLADAEKRARYRHDDADRYR